jgi:hypothetical protein
MILSRKQRDEIVAKGNKAARKNVIMGKELKDPADPLSALMADNIEEAYQKHDCLFVFEAAMVTYLYADSSVGGTAILGRQELTQ